MNYNNMNCRSNLSRYDKTPCGNAPCGNTPCNNAPCNTNTPCRDNPPRNIPCRDNPPRNAPCRDNPPRNIPCHENSTCNTPCRDNPPRNAPCRDNPPCNTPCRDNSPHADSPCAKQQHEHMQQEYSTHKYPPVHECMEIPTGNRRRLLCFINEVSFAVDETLLYLDTHPDCEEALRYFHRYNQLRNRALAKYEQEYGPLVIASANDSCSRSWEWMSQPWPWEGGMC